MRTLIAALLAAGASLTVWADDNPLHGITAINVYYLQEAPNRNLLSVPDLGPETRSSGVCVDMDVTLNMAYTPPGITDNDSEHDNDLVWKRKGFAIWFSNGQNVVFLSDIPIGESGSTWSKVRLVLSTPANNPQVYVANAYTIWGEWDTGYDWDYWTNRTYPTVSQDGNGQWHVASLPPNPYSRTLDLARFDVTKDASVDSRVVKPGSGLGSGDTINANFGSSVYNGGLFVGYFRHDESNRYKLPDGTDRKTLDSSGLARIYLRFDLSQIPTAFGNMVENALVLSYLGTPPGFTNPDGPQSGDAQDQNGHWHSLYTYRTCAVTSPGWDESKIMWQNQPGSSDWNTALGTIDLLPTTPLGLVSSPVTINLNGSLFEPILAMTSDPNGNPTKNPNWRYFQSRESPIGTGFAPPHLWILYNPSP